MSVRNMSRTGHNGGTKAGSGLDHGGRRGQERLAFCNYLSMQLARITNKIVDFTNSVVKDLVGVLEQQSAQEIVQSEALL
jgi:hypothetical protein